MAKPRFELPKSSQEDHLIEALDRVESAAMVSQRAQKIGWIHDLAFLKGIRRFRITDTGEVQVAYQNERGELMLRVEDVLSKRQREIGRLMQMDTRPSVKPKGVGLDALRKASVAQVILDHLESNLSGEKIKLAVDEDLCDFGTVGLAVWVENTVHLGDQPLIEVVPAWELCSLPVEPTRNYDVKGILRHRHVSYEWLKDRAGLKMPRDLEKLDLKELPHGERIQNENEPGLRRSGSGSTGTNTQNSPKDQKRARWVYLREYWIEGENERVARYIVRAGNAIVLDEDFCSPERYTQEGFDPPIMPIGVAHYYSTGFHGRSFVSPLIPVNKQVEKMAANVFQNIIDLDLMGIKIFPTTAGITRASLKDLGRNRYLFADMDYSLPRSQPYSIMPRNMGDMPVKAIGFGMELIDRLSRESDLYSGKAPGRVDSSRSLGLLYETSSIPIIPVTASIANVYKRIYGAMLQAAAKMLKEDAALPLLTLDDSIPGIKLQGGGSMSLDSSRIPKPSEVILDIRERMPRFESKKKAELEEALGSQRIDAIDFIVEALRANIDLPLGNRGIIENIRTQWLENLMMFGDGETPGEVKTNPKWDNHRVHKRILEDFVARPEFRLASEEVQQKFLKHLLWHEEQLGSWPDMIPDPENFQQMPPDLQQMLASAPNGPPPGQGLPGAPAMAFG